MNPAAFCVVNTDNYGCDYPNESFVDGFDTEEAAQQFADSLNHNAGKYSLRYFKVVKMPYELTPGFEP